MRATRRPGKRRIVREAAPASSAETGRATGRSRPRR